MSRIELLIRMEIIGDLQVDLNREFPVGPPYNTWMSAAFNWLSVQMERVCAQLEDRNEFAETQARLLVGLQPKHLECDSFNNLRTSVRKLLNDGYMTSHEIDLWLLDAEEGKY